MKTLKQRRVFVKSVWVIPCSIALALSLGCEQPKVLCQAGRGAFATKFHLLEGTGTCSEIPGDLFGLHTYYHLGSNQLPDYRRPILAIKPESLGIKTDRAASQDLPDSDSNHLPYSIGDFDTAEPGDDSFCAASDLSAAEEDLPELPALPDSDPADEEDDSKPVQPALHAKYEWQDFRVVVTAAYAGTQFLGTLSYTENGCTARYEAWGVMAACACADENGAPDKRLCSAVADPEAGIQTGSGISPDFPVTCDPDLLYCVLTERPFAHK